MIAKKSDFVEILQGLFQVKDLKGKKFSLIAAKNIELIQDALTDLEDQGKPSEEFVELSIKMRALMESVEPDAKEKIKTLEEESSDLIEARKKQIEDIKEKLKVEVELDVDFVEKDDLPEDISMEQLMGINKLLR
tara:strand:+ start:1934 stop:2338 length:405 start_codon:yes stop_codon:yes gene_type:complete